MSYNKAFRAALDTRKNKLAGMLNQERPTTEELDEAADAFQEAHHKAMGKAIPTARVCRHSVPYWDKELSTLHDERMHAKERCKHFKATRGFIPQVAIREYRTADNTFKRRIKRKKKQFF